MASEVLVPSSPAEAVELFGDGAATTVVGGGTIVVADISYGRLDPGRVLLLSHAGLDGVSVDGDTVTIGATTPINALLDARGARCRPRRVRPQPRRLRDSRPGDGRRQPLRRRRSRRAARRPAGLPARARRHAFARRARTASGRSRSRTSSPTGTGASCSTSASSARRPRPSSRSSTPTRTSTPCSRSPARGRPTARPGSPRPASPAPVRAFAPPRRWPSDPAAAGAAAVGDVTFADDALASAWYREQTLPVLVRRVLTQLEESA